MDSGNPPVTLTIPNDPRLMPLVRGFVETVCQVADLDQATTDAVVLATNEAPSTRLGLGAFGMLHNPVGTLRAIGANLMATPRFLPLGRSIWCSTSRDPRPWSMSLSRLQTRTPGEREISFIGQATQWPNAAHMLIVHGTGPESVLTESS